MFVKIEKWKQAARELKTQSYALYFAFKDPRVPWGAKAVAACVVAYVLSPIDLIPDFIPVIGYLDDLIILPLGVALAVKMIPAQIWMECREKAKARTAETKGLAWAGAAAIIAIWILLAGFVLTKLFLK